MARLSETLNAAGLLRGQAAPDLLQQLLAKNPESASKLQLLAQMMGSQEAEEEKSEAQSRRRAKKKLERRERQRRWLAKRNRDVAAALGACPCWGELSACPRCQGQGVPGTQAPNGDAFAEYVLPLLERLGLLKEESEEVSAAAPPRPAEHSHDRQERR